MFSTDKGQVFGWGNSEYGQIPSLVDNHQINIATEIQECRSLGHIVDIAAGGSFCMVLNSKKFILYLFYTLQILAFICILYSTTLGDGNVFVWGYGILGLGPAVQRAKDPTIIPSTLFGLNAYERQVRVRNDASNIKHIRVYSIPFFFSSRCLKYIVE